MPRARLHAVKLLIRKRRGGAGPGEAKGCRAARRRGKAITARWMGRGGRRLLIIIVVSGGREGCVKGSCQSGRQLDPASITTDKKSWPNL